MSIVVLVLVRMRPAHALGNRVGRERWQATGGAREPRTKGIMTGGSSEVVALDLRSSSCEQVDIHPRRSTVAVTRIRTHTCAQMRCIVGVRVWRRHVRGSNLRDWRRTSDGLAWRRHHRGSGIKHTGILTSRCSRRRSDMLGFVTSSRVGVVVNAGVASQFIGTTEAFGAAWELAGMRFLARVRANVTSLMLETMKSPVAKRTLVRTREVLSRLFGGGAGSLHERWQQAYRGRHFLV